MLTTTFKKLIVVVISWLKLYAAFRPRRRTTSAMDQNMMVYNRALRDAALTIVIGHERLPAMEKALLDLERARMEREDYRQGNGPGPAGLLGANGAMNCVVLPRTCITSSWISPLMRVGT